MDEKETITTAPPGVGKGGVLEEEQDCARDAAELAARRARRDARAKEKMIEAINRHKETLASNPRTDLGERAFAERAAAEAEAKAAAEAGAEAGAAAADAAKEIIPAWDQSAADEDDDDDDGPSARQADRPEHYWGQALQYLERGVQVKAKKKVTLLAKREMDRVTFSLKEGVGGYVGKPPWRIEWGGGASVESPHFQRVHYCELLVSDYLMRLKGKRFPPIEKEMRMILAHCGSLFLDPAVIQHTMHRFACLELVHDWENFSAGASMEALTKKPLLLY
jgi:type III protein arginine methyltransferase